jgi:hypothetical protein
MATRIPFSIIQPDIELLNFSILTESGRTNKSFARFAVSAKNGRLWR